MENKEKVLFKRCGICKKSLSSDLFHNYNKSKDRLSYYCKECCKITSKERYKNSVKTEEQRKERNAKGRENYTKIKDKKAKYTKERRKNNPRLYKNLSYKYKYGITIEEYDKMLISQKGNCAICNISQSSLNYSLAVDHCHNSEIVRGLLCRNCNVAIGCFKDNINVIKNSITYLEKFK